MTINICLNQNGNEISEDKNMIKKIIIFLILLLIIVIFPIFLTF